MDGIDRKMAITYIHVPHAGNNRLAACRDCVKEYLYPCSPYGEQFGWRMGFPAGNLYLYPCSPCGEQYSPQALSQEVRTYIHVPHTGNNVYGAVIGDPHLFTYIHVPHAGNNLQIAADIMLIGMDLYPCHPDNMIVDIVNTSPTIYIFRIISFHRNIITHSITLCK